MDIIVERLMKDDKIQTIPRTEKDNNSLLQALCREFEIGHAYSEKGEQSCHVKKDNTV
ncbi:hypothetical protein [Staphylococcus pseudintermedius]|uniref:hypothetical protein n=1 Tax=Staphylococcus pseudintermedius TaxID=283734 RepID=UPI001F0DC9B1|nr:hypothetical protein [Staphylococcus pseudintermedius]